MKKVIYSVLFLFVLPLSIFSQTVTNYGFSTVFGTFNPISGATTPTIVGNTDDGYFTNIPIGFNFIYNSTIYTSLSASTNGFISLGSNISNVNSQNNNLATGLSVATPRPIIAPLWDDLSMSGTNGFSYVTTGTAPNRVFTAQWLNMEWNYNSTPAVSFQVILYEFDSKIEFAYRAESGALVTPTASVGITNTATGSRNFLCLTSFSGLPFDTSTVLETTSINTKPSSGQKFTFAPQFVIPNTATNLAFGSLTATSMDVSWNDNSTTETYYRVLMSTDGVIYNLLGVYPSTTRAGTGATYTQSLTGLIPGNTYYFRVFAGNEGSIATNFLSGSQATVSGVMSGTRTICPTGCNFTSIGNALTTVRNQGVSGNFILELDSTYSASVETYPLSFSNLFTTSANTVTIRPRSNVSNPIVFTGFGTSTFDLNNVQFLTIDGRKGGTGSGGFIIVTNLNGSGAAVRYSNNASNNTITHCNISGATSSSTSAVIVFGTSTGVSGNSNNIVSNCIIKDSLVTPIQSILSNGTTAFPNLNNQILNNSISNYFNGSNNTIGLSIVAASDNWTITGNSFFQQSSRTLSFNNSFAISILTGSTYNISNNHIGGSQTNAGGSPMSFSGSGLFSAMNLTLGTTGTCTVSNNVIRNMDLYLNGTGYSLIQATNGAFNISGNTIGSNTSNNSIYYNSSGSGTIFSGISLTTGSAFDNVTINNNSIGGIAIGGSGVIHFRGINITSNIPSLTITNNLIGSRTSLHSIVDSTNADLFGIYVQLNTAANNISGNTVANLTNTSTSGNSRMIGFGLVNGSFSVNNNAIYNLITNSSNIQTGIVGPITGIVISSGAANHIVSGNSLYNYITTNSTLDLQLTGLNFSVTGSNNRISSNLIHSITPVSPGACTIRGMLIQSPSTQVDNNVIRLGFDTLGNPQTINHTLIGINDAGNSNSYLHNTVHIGGGAAASSTSSSYAYFNSIASTGTRVIANNIFSNTRSNLTSTGFHYATFHTTGTVNGLTINNNIYHAPGTGGVLVRYGTTNHTSMQTWKAVANFDLSSGQGNPNFVSPNGSSNSFSLKIQSPTPAEGSGSADYTTTTDIENQSRTNFTPVDIGAYSGNYLSNDLFSPVITHLAIGNSGNLLNRSFTATIIDPQTGVRTTGGLAPRVWYRRLSPAITGWTSTAGVLTNGTSQNGEWTFTIDYSLLSGGAAVGNIIQYYIVAQDSASTFNLGILPLAGANHADVNSQTTAPTTPFNFSIVSSLPTTISVGTGQTYTTLTATNGLFNAINNGALGGPTTVTIVSDINEPGAVGLSSNGLSGNRLIIVPDNQRRTLTGSYVLGTRGLIHLNGTNGVTIDGGPLQNLVIKNVIGSSPSGSPAPTIWILNGTNDTIRNCIIEGNNNNIVYAPILISTNSALVSSSGHHIFNNIIRGELANVNNRTMFMILQFME
jgi:hypothetical protein